MSIDASALIEHLADLDDEDVEPWLHLASATLDGPLLRLTISIHNDSDDRTSLWVVECHDPVEHRLHLGRHEHVAHLDAHPHLFDHSEPRTSIYVSSKTDEPAPVIAALVEAHRSVVGVWREMSRYLNNQVPLADLLHTGHGRLSKGPATVMSAYAAALEDEGVRTSTLVDGPPVVWDEELQWVEPVGQQRALLLTSGAPMSLNSPQPTSFVIGHSVTARRIEV